MNHSSFRRTAVVLLLAGSATLAGCVSPGGYGGQRGAYANHGDNYNGSNYQPRRSNCHDCGTVTDIVGYEGDGRTTGAGVVAGALLGGLAGNQVGGGDGRRLATVAGAVAGGVAGHRIEQRARSANEYDIHIRLDNGRHTMVQQSGLGGVQIGSYVRVAGGRAQLR